MIKQFGMCGETFTTTNRDCWAERLASICGRSAEWDFIDEPFSGAINVREVGGIKFARCQHNLKELRQDCGSSGGLSSYVMFIMQMRGRALIDQNEVQMRLDTGDVGIIDGSVPFTTQFGGSTNQMITYLPSCEVANSGLASVLTKPQRIASGDAIGCLAKSTILAITRPSLEFDAESAAFTRQMLSNLVQHALRLATERRTDGYLTPALPDRRIRDYIDARLADPSLSPPQIASGCGISVRKLHRNFDKTEWTVCSWIKMRRLELCRQDLLNPLLNVSVSEIAFSRGFNDAAHFSRSFREWLGISPREYRERYLDV